VQDNVIGGGPVGSTAIGLDLLREQVVTRLRLPDEVDVAVEVPAFSVIAADVFSAFLQRNRLRSEDLVELSDRQIAREFSRGELPEGIREELCRVADRLDGPLIVRPSSVLEASLERSFGVAYLAKIVPNHSDDSVKRCRQLVDALKLVWASSYDPDSDRLGAGLGGPGPRALTFAPLLQSRSIPFTSIVETILECARTATGDEVVVEIAATLDPIHGVPVRFGVVQLKTMSGRSGGDSLKPEDLIGDGILAASADCLGDGRRGDLDDIVYLKPAAFDRDRTRTIVAELEAVNRGILDEGRSAIFIGFGRWGTTDERYGVPVRWGQISSAQVIVEITLAEAPLNLSQGTHFFHHLLSQRVLYLSLEHDGEYGVDFDWLDQVPAVWEGRYVRHVRTERPVEVDVDGGSRRGLIRREL
jgi:hypothetical protein